MHSVPTGSSGVMCKGYQLSVPSGCSSTPSKRRQRPAVNPPSQAPEVHPIPKRVLRRRGVIYIANISGRIAPQRLRKTMESYGEVSRLHCKVEDTAASFQKSKKKGARRQPPSVMEAWVEFLDRRAAKEVARFLKSSHLTCSRRQRDTREDALSARYLPDFTWDTLEESILNSSKRKAKASPAQLPASHMKPSPPTPQQPKRQKAQKLRQHQRQQQQQLLNPEPPQTKLLTGNTTLPRAPARSSGAPGMHSQQSEQARPCLSRRKRLQPVIDEVPLVATIPREEEQLLKFAKLSQEETRLSKEGLWGDGHSSDVLASRFSVELTRGQLACLRPGGWLNDEVINFYFKLLQERCKRIPGMRKCWLPNSFFWPMLCGRQCMKYSYTDVKRWSKRAQVDVFSVDYVLFPMNVNGMHWAVGVIDFRDRGFRYLDSMFGSPHPNFATFLRCYVNDEHRSRHGTPLKGIGSWDMLEEPMGVPKQHNGYDCGVFTCGFADCLASGRPLLFGQANMPMLRRRLAARIMQADEMWDDA